jgi:hypothetical protein
MVESFATLFCSLDENRHLLFHRALANIFIEPQRPQRAVKTGVTTILNT